MCIIVEYVPYTISVSAYTSAGRGNESKTTAFIKEGGKNKHYILKNINVF